jgi:hypothetical protein
VVAKEWSGGRLQERGERGYDHGRSEHANWESVVRNDRRRCSFLGAVGIVGISLGDCHIECSLCHTLMHADLHTSDHALG